MIHPTAVIASGAKLGANVEVGPYAVIDGEVTVGDNVRIGPHVHLTGVTTIGTGTKIHAGAVIGDEPQDLHNTGEGCTTVIGKNCIIREYATIHRGAAAGSSTVVGDGVLMMAFSHLGHNCRLGDNAIIGNATLLAGHVQVGEKTFISGGGLVHQFCRIGAYTIVGGGARLGQDIPPYCMYQWGGVGGPNAVGLKRNGFDAATRAKIRKAIKIYFFSGLNRIAALAKIREEIGEEMPAVKTFIEFIETTKRGIVPGYGTGEEKDAAAE
jgi:UDP-N-acetylglucosamine acyltransferase